MQPPRSCDQVVARAKKQMVGIRKHDLGTHLGEIPVGDRLDRAAGADRHERRCLHDAVWCSQLAPTRSAIDMEHTKSERVRHCGILPPCSGHSTAAAFPAPVASHSTDCPVRLRIGVVYGGRSSEHEVSLASAASVFDNLDPDRYEAIPIFISKAGRWSIADGPPSAASAADVIEQTRSRSAPSALSGPEVHFLAHPAEAPVLTIRRARDATDDGAHAVVGQLGLDVVFPVVHGPFGEDGTLQGLLELGNVPYVGAGVLASAVGMDKAVAKTLFQACGLPIVDHALVAASQWDADRDTTVAELMRRFEFPLFVKPANLGSSVGVSKVGNQVQLAQGIDLARRYDRKILVEISVPEARELECAVLGNDAPKASVVGEIAPAGEFYDYKSKYLDESSTMVIPAALAPGQADAIRAMAIEAFHAVDGAGMARVDFLMPRKGEQIYVNELNTIPGFTTISMYAKLWHATGLDYPQLLDRLIELALEHHAAKQRLHTSLPS